MLYLVEILLISPQQRILFYTQSSVSSLLSWHMPLSTLFLKVSYPVVAERLAEQTFKSKFQTKIKDVRMDVFYLGGEGDIRTLGTIAGTTVFKTVPLNHSGTSP